MDKEKFDTIAVERYGDIPKEVEELIKPFFYTDKIQEILAECCSEYVDNEKIYCVEQERSTFCHGFKIRYLNQPNKSSRVIVTFDILCPATANQDGCFLVNATAEIVQDNKFIRMIYVITQVTRPKVLNETFIEKKNKLTQEHTLDCVTPQGIERKINHITPKLSSEFFNEIKRQEDIEPKGIIQNLRDIGERRIDHINKYPDVYSNLLDSTKIDNGSSKKLNCHK